jgi:hypothetical protein
MLELLMLQAVNTRDGVFESDVIVQYKRNGGGKAPEHSPRK